MLSINELKIEKIMMIRRRFRVILNKFLGIYPHFPR